MHPVILEIGFVKVYSYGFAIAVAFFICAFLISLKFKEIGLEKGLAFDLVMYLLIFGIIGARLLHIILNAGYYSNNLKEIFMIQHGGLVWHGGLIAASIAGIIFIKKHKLNLAVVCDSVVPYAALGQAIGRIGCYFNGCCYGRPTDFFLGVNFPGRAFVVHPTQLYLSFSFLLLFIVLKKIEQKKAFDWQVFASYFMLYPAIRFSIDFLRGDLAAVLFGLTVSQLISLGLFIMGLIIYLWRRNKILK